MRRAAPIAGLSECTRLRETKGRQRPLIGSPRGRLPCPLQVQRAHNGSADGSDSEAFRRFGARAGSGGGRAARLFRREFRRVPNWCARRSDDSDTCRRAASGASAASPSARPHYRRAASGYTARPPGRDARVPAASASQRPSAG